MSPIDTGQMKPLYVNLDNVRGDAGLSERVSRWRQAPSNIAGRN